MTRVYRILRKRYAKHPFDGEGAYRYGGRWSSPGVRLAYASEHYSLAMIEYFVHLDRDDPPPDLVVATADVPDDVSRTKVGHASLPRTWRETPAPAELAAIGFEVYPNPTSGIFTVKGTGYFAVIITDASGRVVMNTDATEHTTIDLSAVERGMYFVNIEKDGERHTIRLIRQ